MENQLKERYELETRLLRTERALAENADALKQANYDLRNRQEEEKLYSGSMRSFLDGLTGKREEKQESLRRASVHARAELDSLTKEEARLLSEQESLRKKGTSLPAMDALRERAVSCPETAGLWAKLEAKYCAELVLPLLDATEEALEDYRQQLRGNKMGEIVTPEQGQEIGTAHIDRAKQCMPALNRLKAAMELLGQPFEIGGYFESPAGFIVSAAARHNRLDRANLALDQIAAIRKQIKVWME